MNRHALFHKPQSEWAYPISQNEAVIRFRAAKGDLAKVELAVKYKYNEKPITTLNMEKRFSDTMFDYYECVMPTDRGRRTYHFVLTGAGGETVYYTELGAQEPKDIADAYFPHFQLPFVSDSDILTVPDKFKNAVIYQIFPDRFYTDNKKCDWSKDPKYNDFFGGELIGAAKKLPYLKDLGITAVYLTPINPSHTNHHYDVEDYYHVAPELGGDVAFAEFVKKAHDLGISVILDGVFNHCSVLNPMFRDAMEKGRASEYFDWFIVDGDRPDFNRCNYQTFAFNIAYMPKLNGDNGKVRDFVCDVTTHWIKNFGIDAWRLDVADDVSPALWREVRQAVKGADKNAIMIGEDWMDPSAFLRGDVFDGVMNYGFTRAARDYLAYGVTGAEGAAERLIRNYMRTISPAADMMMNIIGSHDTHRFFSLCGENGFLHKAALCMMFFYDGMPTVYYGDELPLRGLHDPDCRRGFDWSRTGSDTAELVKTLAEMKKSEGARKMSIYAQNNTLVIKRTSGQKENALFINASKENGMIPARTVKTVIDGEEREVRE